MNTRELLQRRAALTKQLRDAQDTADTASGGTMTSEQTSAFDAVKAALADLEEALSRRSLIEEAERRASGVNLTAPADRGFERSLAAFSITRAIAHAAGLDVDAGREREVSQEIARRSGRKFEGIAIPIQALSRPLERRSITTGLPSDGPGGNLIATLLDGSEYVDILRAALVIRQLGARVLTGLTSNVDIPRLARAASVGWTAENTPLPVTDEAFDKISLRPKHAGAIVELSRNMLQQVASPDIEQLVRSDLAAVLARALDSAAIYGDGLSFNPVGILRTPGVPVLSLGPNGAPLNYDAIADLMGLPMSANAMGESMGFLGNTKVRQHVAKMLNLQGQPLGFETIFEGAPQAWSNLVPSNGTKGTGTGLSTLIYGNWSDLILGFWSELDVLVNPFDSAAYSKGNVLVRAMMTCDIAVRHPQSFAAIVDINTAAAATVTP